MSQSKMQTWIEVHTSTWIGFVGSWLIAVAVLRYVDIGPEAQATLMTVLCTVWSLARGYCVRRYFNSKAQDAH